jgi:hypothetical protein
MFQLQVDDTNILIAHTVMQWVIQKLKLSVESKQHQLKHFYKGTVNLTNVQVNDEELHLLNKGLNYNMHNKLDKLTMGHSTLVTLYETFLQHL